MAELAEQALKAAAPEDDEPASKRRKSATKNCDRPAEKFTGPSMIASQLEVMNNVLLEHPGMQYSRFVDALVVSIGDEAADAVLASKDPKVATVISTIQGTYWAVVPNRLDDGQTFIFKQEKPIGVRDDDVLNNKELLLWFNPDEKSGHRGWWISEKIFQGNRKASGLPTAGALAWMPPDLENVLIPPYESVHVPYYFQKKYSGITVEPLHDFNIKFFKILSEQDDGDEVLDDDADAKQEPCGPAGCAGLGRWDQHGRFSKGGWLNRACDIMGALKSGNEGWAHQYVQEYMQFAKAKHAMAIWYRHFGGGDSGLQKSKVIPQPLHFFEIFSVHRFLITTGALNFQQCLHTSLCSGNFPKIIFSETSSDF